MNFFIKLWILSRNTDNFADIAFIFCNNDAKDGIEHVFLFITLQLSLKWRYIASEW